MSEYYTNLHHGKDTRVSIRYVPADYYLNSTRQDETPAKYLLGKGFITIEIFYGLTFFFH